MTEQEAPARHDRRAAGAEDVHRPGAERRRARQQARARERRATFLRKAAFGAIAVAVLAIGAFFAFGDFFSRPTGGTAANVIDIQSSMAGFTPSEIRVKAGTTATFNWWTQDAAVHLEGGVHTMVAPDLGLREELKAEGSRLVVWQVPDKPGTYDVWCESCCGGKDSPTMHGTIVVEPATAAAAPRSRA